MPRRRQSRTSRKSRKKAAGSGRMIREKRMPKAGSGRKNNRQELVIRAKSSTSGDTERRVVRFHNDDVPKFLKQLAEFQEESRKHPITLK